MAKPSRWTQWVISESADPRVPMPWNRRAEVRHDRRPRPLFVPA
ncbi:MAG TPA: hypothetical protein PLG62_00465 [Pararhodobacter sp.]|nr:hypothetical protein [Pararhodobacter sp.]HPD90901.1 hypothetical protein [Pararhodobacter sp.]